MQDTQVLFDAAQAKVIKLDGCWRFTGTLNAEGYGRVRIPDRRWVFAHRLFYEHLVGPIPDGLEIDHKCGFRNCVNPEHLESRSRTPRTCAGRVSHAAAAVTSSHRRTRTSALRSTRAGCA